MTPKEKAIELVEKFIPYSYYSDGNNSMERRYQQEDNAKECALIAVDEIVKHKPSEPRSFTDTYGYWQEVKQEIENYR